MANKQRGTLPYLTAKQDLAIIIAQETSGFVGAVPEDEDYQLADDLVNIINERYEP